MFSKLLTLTAIVAQATADWCEADVAPQDVIHKDVVIIGGGASGTYAAVRLREDYNKSIVVVERDDHLVTRSLETSVASANDRYRADMSVTHNLNTQSLRQS